MLDFLNENARVIQNAERRERYHTPYHLEALDYESGSVAYHDTPERIVIRKEDAERIRAALALLTETQRRRLLMMEEGKTLREIAESEGVAVSSVKESLDAARKKIQEISETTRTKQPFFLRMVRRPSSETLNEKLNPD